MRMLLLKLCLYYSYEQMLGILGIGAVEIGSILKEKKKWRFEELSLGKCRKETGSIVSVEDLHWCSLTFRSQLLKLTLVVQDFPVAQTADNLPAVLETQVRSLGQEDPLEKGITLLNPLRYSCLENSMGREARWAAVHGVIKSRIQLSN